MMKKPNNDEVPRKTLELNYEVKLFNDRLKSHLDVKTVDLQLLEQLQNTTELITQLMSDCSLISNETIDVSSTSTLQLHRQLYCHICNMMIKTDIHKVQDHLTGKMHQQFVAKAAKKEQKKKGDLAKPAQANPIVNKTKPEGTEEDEQVTEIVQNGRPQKLSKKVLSFIRDRNLESLGRKLAEEGAKIENSSKYCTVIESIRTALKSKYPNVKAYPFGSRISGLGTYDSDLDVFIDLDNQYFKHASNLPIPDFRYIEQQLKSTKQWIEFYSITEARTPIMQAFFIPEKLPCDLSFSNGLSHCNSKLIKYFIDIQPLFAKVAAVIKEWGHEADMKMNSYALTLLLVFYFQHVKLLPTVHQLQKNKTAKLIGYWDGHIESNAWTGEKSNDFRTHLIGFFDYFGNSFDFKNMVVCPYLGVPIEKTRFHYGKENLPEELKSYMDYIKKIDLKKANVLTDLFAYDKPMVVQDPFELIHNVAKGVRTYERFSVYCKLTAEFLKTKRVI